jgi:hypothetical protein
LKCERLHSAAPHLPGEKRGLWAEPSGDQGAARTIDSSVSATLLRATRYAGSKLSNAKQGALRSAKREGGLSALRGFPSFEFNKIHIPDAAKLSLVELQR